MCLWTDLGLPFSFLTLFAEEYSLLLYRDGNSTEIVKCTALDEDYEYFVEKVWPWIDLAAYSFVPLSIIVICNVAIVVKVWLHRHFMSLSAYMRAILFRTLCMMLSNLRLISRDFQVTVPRDVQVTVPNNFQHNVPQDVQVTVPKGVKSLSSRVFRSLSQTTFSLMSPRKYMSVSLRVFRSLSQTAFSLMSQRTYKSLSSRVFRSLSQTTFSLMSPRTYVSLFPGTFR